jgi:hypothetical protein
MDSDDSFHKRVRPNNIHLSTFLVINRPNQQVQLEMHESRFEKRTRRAREKAAVETQDLNLNGISCKML